MRLLALVVALALLTAGCLGGTGPAGPAGDSSGGDGSEAGGATEEDASDPVPEPTLAAPPAWEAGDWFAYRISEQFTGSTYEVTRVVTGPEPGTDSHLVGMPRDEWSDKALVLHVPGFGQIDRPTLGFEIHDCPFQPLDFPLEDGESWTTEFECREVDATVTVEDETTATIRMVGGSDDLTLTYDAEVGAITSYEIEGYATIELIDHGTGWEGTATVPHMHDLIFQHGRLAGAVDLNLQPAPPVESVEVDSTYHRVSFVVILGALVPRAGVYHERVEAPDGSVFSHTVTPADEPGFHLFFHQVDDPGGTWDLTHVAGGPGIAMTEGIGYHVFDEQVGNATGPRG